MSALLTIFCNLLQNPQDLRRGEDLKLLSGAPGCLRSNLVARPSSDISQVKAVIDFLVELNRLALCAISKAGMEHS